MGINKNKELRSSINSSGMLSGVRIARISTVPFFVITQLKQQLETINDSGAHVTVITSNAPELDMLENLSGIECVPIEIPRSISLWRDLLALIQLFQYFRRTKFDIVHSTTPKAGLLTAIAAFLAGVPIRLHTFTGQAWVTKKGPVRWIARGSDWLIGKLNTRCYADSESQRQFLIRQGVISSKRLFVIGAGSLAGVALDRFDPNSFSGPERNSMKETLEVPLDSPIILFVGRITAEKGVRELIAAFRELKVLGSAAHLVFVGPFDSDIGVREAGEDFNINGKDIHIVGHTECPEAYMSIADVLCLPSYREGFGTVVIEAAAMGLPTVATNIYGLSDAVVNGETGILVPPHNSEALVIALSTLLGNEGQRLAMGRVAKQRVEALFSSRVVNNKLIEEYRYLLKDNVVS